MLDDQRPTPLPKPTSLQLMSVHRLCERFEESWRRGQSLTIEQLLSESTVELRPYLLEALVRSEVELLESSGQPVEPREYLQRFASESGIVARAFMSPDKLDVLDSADTCASVVGDAATAIHSARPQKLGHFEIRDEIARGGMGVVYRGWHDELKREVAVKCIRAGELADESTIQRFRREAQTVASLKHDGIVPVYEVGNEQGLYYFVMPLIEGDSLGMRLTRGPIAHRELARIVHDSALATQFAHDHGVIHRDLKPSNILVDQQGKVWVADFGLSTSIQTNEGADASQARYGGDLSLTGQIVGTPSFMAPEQTQGRADELTDVYGLGAVLYTGLTGRPPHRAATLVQTLTQVMENEPAAPRALDPQIPKDLETITLKALNKTASQRYCSAKELAEDLTRYLDGHTIQAKPASSLERIWRWIKREPVVASLAVGIMLALAIGLGVSLRFYSLATTNARIAYANEKLAQESVQEYLTQVADSPELNEKGLEVLRRQLLQSALTFYERLAARSPDSLTLQESVAEAHEHLGKIHASLGNQPKATEQFQKMLDAYQQLQTKHPSHIEYERASLEALIQLAEVHSKPNDFDEVGELLTQAIARCKNLLERYGNELTDRITRASLYGLEIQNYSNAAKAGDVQKQLQPATELCAVISKALDASLSPSSARRFLRTLDRMASQLQNVGNFDDTEKLCKLGIELCSNERIPGNRDLRSRFIEARLHKNLNLLYVRTNRGDLAMAEFEKSNRILTDLLNEHPLVLEMLDQKATLVANAGVMQAMKGKYDEAQKFTEEALELQKTIIARQPDVADNWSGLGNIYATLAAIHRNQFQYPEAEEALKLGIQANERDRQANEKKAGTIYFGLNLKTSLAETYTAQKRYKEAIEILRPHSHEVLAFAEQNQGVPTFQLLAAATFRTLASNERNLKNMEDARKAAEQSIAFFEKLPPQMVSVGMTPRILSDALYTQGTIGIANGDFDVAQASIERGLGILDPLVADPLTPPGTAILFRAPRAELYDLQGQLGAAKGNHQAAVEEFNKAIADQQVVTEQSKSQPVVLRANREKQALVQLHLARALLQLKKYSEALQACDAASAMNPDSVEEAKTLRAEIEQQAKQE